MFTRFLPFSEIHLLSTCPVHLVTYFSSSLHSIFAAKADRLKQAKDEAEKEVAAYKAEREAEFRQKVAEDTTSNRENVERLEAESERAIAEIRTNVNAKKEQVLSLLLGQVQAVK